MTTTWLRVLRLVAVAMALHLTVLAGPGAASTVAASYQLIQGSGSSWAANAVNQWVAEVEANGMQVVYTQNGAAQGRKDYANKQTDFGVTDSPYRGQDPSTGAVDSPLGRSFAYLPVVAGGTSFPYNLVVSGQQVRNLRLSGETIAKIFTNQITNWNDAAITADNNGYALPSIPIIPVVRSDGAGVTNQFTTWMVNQYGSLWQACNGGKLAPTDYFPLNCGQTRGPMRGQSGSDGVMAFVKSDGANGAIAMEEYSYPLQADFPVAKMLNKAGYFTLPTQYNVAVALTAAQINNDPNDPNYLTQKLDAVYVNPDKRTYPLSSYVYAIIPTASDDSRMTTAKRQTLTDFLKHSICEGQSSIGKIGYSPLPINLVQAGFTQVNKLKLADDVVVFDASIIQDVKNCHNPTFVAGNPAENYLAKIAPMPAECDKPGAGPCGDNVGAINGDPENGKAPKGPKGDGKGGGTGTGDGGGTDPGTTAPDATGGVDAPVAGPEPVIANDLGLGGPVAADTATTDAALSVVATTIPDDGAAGNRTWLVALVVGLFLGALVVPTAVSRSLRRRGGR